MTIYDPRIIENKLEELDRFLEPYMRQRAEIRNILATIRSQTIASQTDDGLIEHYLRNRDLVLPQYENETGEVINALKREQHDMETDFARRLRERGAENTRTDHGCAFFKESTSVRTEDKDAFKRHVIGEQAWDLIDFRPAKTECENFEHKNGAPPPGVNIEHIVKVHVRKS